METNAPTLSGLEPLLSIEELSEYLNVPIRTLYDWRLAGKGPCAVHVGRQLRYFVSDVHDWLWNQRDEQGGEDQACLGHARASSNTDCRLCLETCVADVLNQNTAPATK